MSGECKNIINLIVSIIETLLGISAFIIFFCVYGNREAGVWAAISGTLAAVCFHLHYLYFKERLDSWHSVETLKSLQLLGVMGLTFGLAGLSWYIFTTLYHHIPIMPVASSSPISAVWAFMTAKCGLLLIINSRMYVGIFQRDYPGLITL